MSHSCEHHASTPAATSSNPRYRRVLWAALIINTLMFVVEVVGGLQAHSVSLLADAIDFLGDAANYALSLWVLNMSLKSRARAALAKGLSMAGFGLFVLGQVIWSALTVTVPSPLAMGGVAALALVANVSVALMLYAWREGDANMRSVWLCSRNDAIGNLAVMVAATGVLSTGSSWPDLLVATGMGVLALASARSVVSHAQHEMRTGDAEQASPP